MSLQRILGSSGSGKTTLLYDKIISASIKHPQQNFIILVPEQFTMQVQKDIVTIHPSHGTMNIDIVSFERLAYRIFEELAVEHLQVLDDMGKSMILRKVLGNIKNELMVFQSHINKKGFINQLKSTLSEFYQYGIEPNLLQQTATEAKNPLLRQKLIDLAIVLKGFEEYIKGNFITTEEILDVLCRHIEESQIIKNSVIALDGYTGFTPVQYRLIRLFLIHSKQVIITITADKKEQIQTLLPIQSLFHMSSVIAKKLERLVEDTNCNQLKDVWLEGGRRFQNAKEIGFLEQMLFRYDKRRWELPTRDILLYEGKTPKDEVSFVLEELLTRIRKNNLRYRDFAIVTGDLTSYGIELSNQMRENGIPHFLDDKKTMINNPLVEFIRALIELVRLDFSYESVFRLLRTGFITADLERVDQLENYVLGLGIRGYKRWSEEWTYVVEGNELENLMELNELRELLIQSLGDFYQSLKGKEMKLAEITYQIIVMLERFQLKEKMESYQMFFHDQKEFRLEKEYEQSYEIVMNLLTEISNLLGEEALGLKEYLDILDSGFEEIQVGVIPSTVDRVVVGDITRSRLAHVKVLFFIGLNDGIIPIRNDGGSILSDHEKEFLTSFDIELSPTVREDSFIQKFYLYLMLSKPQQSLYLSYALIGGDGKTKRKSYLIGEIKKIFPHLSNVERNVDHIYNLKSAKRAWIESITLYREEGKEESRAKELLQWIRSQEGQEEWINGMLEGVFFSYEEKGIGASIANTLYGSALSASVTRMEQYAQCAYQHFLTYGLELRERKQYQLAAMDIGNLFHQAIDTCFKQVKEQNLDWHTLSDGHRTSRRRSCSILCQHHPI